MSYFRSWHKIRPPPSDLQYFNLNFNEAKDVFYCHINETEPEFLEENSESESDEEVVYIDPRTRQVVTDLIRNFQNLNSSKQQKFPQFPTKSVLSRKTHIATIRVLEAKQNKTQIKLADLNLFNATAEKRTKENQQFVEFLKGHCTQNIKEIIDVTRELSSLFLTYAEEMVCFQLQSPDKYFSLRTALPLNYGSGEVTTLKSEIIHKSSWSPLLNVDNVNFAKLQRSQNELLKLLLANCGPDDVFAYDKKCDEFLGSHDAIIPEESVMTLLSTFLEESSPWEMLVHIEERTNFMEDSKILKFSKPLARRTFGLSDMPILFENMFEIFSKISETAGTSQNHLKNETDDEIYAMDLQRSYKVVAVDDYMKMLKMNKSTEKNSNESKSNFILTEWEINCGNKPVKLLTQRNVALFSKKEDASMMINTSLKFEYKTSYGAEIMTKSELLKEWIRQALTPSSYTERIRIDAKTFEPLLHQKLQKSDIEDEFLRLYNVNPQNLLSSLHGTIGAVQNFPKGEYMLRFDLKHKDKIMVYSSTDDREQNTITIHKLYSGGVQQVNEFEFVPIDNTVVTPLHKTHSVLPCCFPHWGTKREVGYNDRTEILKKLELLEKEKINQKKKMENARAKKRKLVKIAKKKAKAKKVAKAKKADLDEFGFNSDEFDKEIGLNAETERNEFRLSEYLNEASNSQT